MVKSWRFYAQTQFQEVLVSAIIMIYINDICAPVFNFEKTRCEKAIKCSAKPRIFPFA